MAASGVAGLQDSADKVHHSTLFTFLTPRDALFEFTGRINAAPLSWPDRHDR